MSLSNPNSFSKNLATKNINFKKGGFSYWDKEKQENVELKLPLSFIVLDELMSVGGWDGASNSGIWSNQLHFSAEAELTVKSKGGVIVKGFYADIKPRIAEIGGKYVQNVYAFMDGEIVRFSFSGASSGAWFNKETKSAGLGVKETEERKKGSVTYKVPVFTEKTFSDEEMRSATEADQDLQEYFKGFNAKEEAEAETRNATPEDLDFGKEPAAENLQF